MSESAQSRSLDIPIPISANGDTPDGSPSTFIPLRVDVEDSSQAHDRIISASPAPSTGSAASTSSSSYSSSSQSQVANPFDEESRMQQIEEEQQQGGAVTESDSDTLRPAGSSEHVEVSTVVSTGSGSTFDQDEPVVPIESDSDNENDIQHEAATIVAEAVGAALAEIATTTGEPTSHDIQQKEITPPVEDEQGSESRSSYTSSGSSYTNSDSESEKEEENQAVEERTNASDPQVPCETANQPEDPSTISDDAVVVDVIPVETEADDGAGDGTARFMNGTEPSLMHVDVMQDEPVASEVPADIQQQNDELPTTDFYQEEIITMVADRDVVEVAVNGEPAIIESEPVAVEVTNTTVDEEVSDVESSASSGSSSSSEQEEERSEAQRISAEHLPEQLPVEITNDVEEDVSVTDIVPESSEPCQGQQQQEHVEPHTSDEKPGELEPLPDQPGIQNDLESSLIHATIVRTVPEAADFEQVPEQFQAEVANEAEGTESSTVPATVIDVEISCPTGEEMDAVQHVRESTDVSDSAPPEQLVTVVGNEVIMPEIALKDEMEVKTTQASGNTNQADMESSLLHATIVRVNEGQTAAEAAAQPFAEPAVAHESQEPVPFESESNAQPIESDEAVLVVEPVVQVTPAIQQTPVAETVSHESTESATSSSSEEDTHEINDATSYVTLPNFAETEQKPTERAQQSHERMPTTVVEPMISEQPILEAIIKATYGVELDLLLHDIPDKKPEHAKPTRETITGFSPVAFNTPLIAERREPAVGITLASTSDEVIQKHDPENTEIASISLSATVLSPVVVEPLLIASHSASTAPATLPTTPAVVHVETSQLKDESVAPKLITVVESQPPAIDELTAQEVHRKMSATSTSSEDSISSSESSGGETEPHMEQSGTLKQATGAEICTPAVVETSQPKDDLEAPIVAAIQETQTPVAEEPVARNEDDKTSQEMQMGMSMASESSTEGDAAKASLPVEESQAVVTPAVVHVEASQPESQIQSAEIGNNYASSRTSSFSSSSSSSSSTSTSTKENGTKTTQNAVDEKDDASSDGDDFEPSDMSVVVKKLDWTKNSNNEPTSRRRRREMPPPLFSSNIPNREPTAADSFTSPTSLSILSPTSPSAVIVSPYDTAKFQLPLIVRSPVGYRPPKPAKKQRPKIVTVVNKDNNKGASGANQPAAATEIVTTQLPSFSLSFTSGTSPSSPSRIPSSSQPVQTVQETFTLQPAALTVTSATPSANQSAIVAEVALGQPNVLTVTASSPVSVSTHKEAASDINLPLPIFEVKISQPSVVATTSANAIDTISREEVSKTPPAFEQEHSFELGTSEAEIEKPDEQQLSGEGPVTTVVIDQSITASVAPAAAAEPVNIEEVHEVQPDQNITSAESSAITVTTVTERIEVEHAERQNASPVANEQPAEAARLKPPIYSRQRSVSSPIKPQGFQAPSLSTVRASDATGEGESNEEATAPEATNKANQGDSVKSGKDKKGKKEKKEKKKGAFLNIFCCLVPRSRAVQSKEQTTFSKKKKAKESSSKKSNKSVQETKMVTTTARHTVGPISNPYVGSGAPSDMTATTPAYGSSEDVYGNAEPVIEVTPQPVTTIVAHGTGKAPAHVSDTETTVVSHETVLSSSPVNTEPPDEFAAKLSSEHQGEMSETAIAHHQPAEQTVDVNDPEMRSTCDPAATSDDHRVSSDSLEEATSPTTGVPKRIRLPKHRFSRPLVTATNVESPEQSDNEEEHEKTNLPTEIENQLASVTLDVQINTSSNVPSTDDTAVSTTSNQMAEDSGRPSTCKPRPKYWVPTPFTAAGAFTAAVPKTTSSEQRIPEHAVSVVMSEEISAPANQQQVGEPHPTNESTIIAGVEMNASTVQETVVPAIIHATYPSSLSAVVIEEPHPSEPANAKPVTTPAIIHYEYPLRTDSGVIISELYLPGHASPPPITTEPPEVNVEPAVAVVSDVSQLVNENNDVRTNVPRTASSSSNSSSGSSGSSSNGNDEATALPPKSVQLKPEETVTHGGNEEVGQKMEAKNNAQRHIAKPSETAGATLTITTNVSTPPNEQQARQPLAKTASAILAAAALNIATTVVAKTVEEKQPPQKSPGNALQYNKADAVANQPASETRNQVPVISITLQLPTEVATPHSNQLPAAGVTLPANKLPSGSITLPDPMPQWVPSTSATETVLARPVVSSTATNRGNNKQLSSEHSRTSSTASSSTSSSTSALSADDERSATTAALPQAGHSEVKLKEATVAPPINTTKISGSHHRRDRSPESEKLVEETRTYVITPEDDSNQPKEIEAEDKEVDDDALSMTLSVTSWDMTLKQDQEMLTSVDDVVENKSTDGDDVSYITVTKAAATVRQHNQLLPRPHHIEDYDGAVTDSVVLNRITWLTDDEVLERIASTNDRNQSAKSKCELVLTI